MFRRRAKYGCGVLLAALGADAFFFRAETLSSVNHRSTNRPLFQSRDDLVMLSSGSSPVPPRRLANSKPNFVNACEAFQEERTRASAVHSRQQQLKQEQLQLLHHQKQQKMRIEKMQQMQQQRSHATALASAAAHAHGTSIAAAASHPHPSSTNRVHAPGPIPYPRGGSKHIVDENSVVSGEGGILPQQGSSVTSKNMRRFVRETTLPVHEIFEDYRDLGVEELMDERYRVNMLSYYVEVQANLTDHLGRVPTVDEWAYSLNIAVKDLIADIMKSQEVKSQLVRRHGGLVRSVAESYRGKGVPMRDLIQEGSCGLIHAAEKFDPAHGYKFSTYARHWIRQHISRALATHSRMIRLPQRVHEKVVTMGRVKTEMSTALGRDPTLAEIAERAQVKTEQARFYVAAAAPVASVDSSGQAGLQQGVGSSGIADGAASPIGDRIMDTSTKQPEAEVEEGLLRREIEKKLLSVLPEIEREVILLRFGLKDGRPRSYEEVIELMMGTEIHSKKCVIKAETRAFYKLRKPSIINQLSELRSCVSDYEAISSSTGAPEGNN